MTGVPGWDLATMRRLAGLAAARSRAETLSFHDKFSVALSTIGETITLATAAGIAITENEMITECHRAIYAESQLVKQMHGTRAGAHSTGARFHAYWHQPAAPWEDTLLDRLAARQLWPLLSAGDRKILGALIICDGSTRAAARSLGMTYQHYHGRLYDSRRRAMALWHAPEPAPTRVWAKGRGFGTARSRMKAIIRKRKARA